MRAEEPSDKMGLPAAGAGGQRPGCGHHSAVHRTDPRQRATRLRWRSLHLVQILQLTQRETEAQGGYDFPTGIKNYISYSAIQKSFFFSFLGASLGLYFNVPVITSLAIINPLFASVSPYIKSGGRDGAYMISALVRACPGRRC